MSSTPLLIRIVGDNREFRAALAGAGADLNTFEGKVSQVSASMSRLGTAMTVGISLPAVAAGSAVLKAAADMDSLRRALLSTAGSAEEAEKQFERLKQIAKLPGIGLEEAVRGSIRLQNYGLSVGQAEKALRGFSNAVAAAGGKTEDTQEALRQLGQIFGRQTVTMDNLRIVLERVPQAAKIIRENFGAEALADPAKTFERLGISSAQFVDILVNKMAELPPVSVGIKTALENFRQEVTISAARIGDTMVPAVLAVLPQLERMATATADLVVWFSKLPPEITNTALALGGLLIAAGPILSIAGRVAALSAELKAFGGFSGVAGGLVLGTQLINDVRSFSASVSELGKEMQSVGRDAAAFGEKMTTVFVAVARGVGGQYLVTMVESLKKLSDEAGKVTRPLLMISEAIDKITAASRAFSGRDAGMDDSIRALISTQGGMNNAPSTYQIIKNATEWSNGIQVVRRQTVGLTAEIKDQHGAIVAKTEAVKKLDESWVISELEQERLRIIENNRKKIIHEVAQIMVDLNTVTLEQTRLALDAADAVNKWTLAMYGLAAAPEIAIPAITMKQMPRVTGISELPRAVNLPDNVSSQNVGPTGMMTRGQFDQIEQAAKAARRATSETMRQISTIITDAGRSISRSLTDLIFVRPKVDVSKYKDDIADLTAEQAKLLEQQRRGQNVAAALEANTRKLAEANRKMAEEVKKASIGFRALEAAKSIVADLAQSIIRVLIEGALKRLAGSLASLGGLFGKVFGGLGGTAASTAGSAASSVGGAAGGIGGSVGGAAAGGITGIVGAVGSVVSAVSGIVGNFQMAGMNKSLDLIEKEVRYSQIHLFHILNKLNEYIPYLKLMHERSFQIWPDGAMAGGGDSYTFNFAAGSLGTGVSQSQVEAAFRTAVEKFKRQGIN